MIFLSVVSSLILLPFCCLTPVSSSIFTSISINKHRRKRTTQSFFKLHAEKHSYHPTHKATRTHTNSTNSKQITFALAAAAAVFLSDDFDNSITLQPNAHLQAASKDTKFVRFRQHTDRLKQDARSAAILSQAVRLRSWVTRQSYDASLATYLSRQLRNLQTSKGIVIYWSNDG